MSVDIPVGQPVLKLRDRIQASWREKPERIPFRQILEFVTIVTALALAIISIKQGADLQQRVEDSVDTIERLQQALAETMGELQEMSAHVASVSSKVNLTGEKLDQTFEHAETLQAAVMEIASHLDKLDLDGVESRIIRLEATADEIEADISKVGVISSAIAALGQDVETLKKRRVAVAGGYIVASRATPDVTIPEGFNASDCGGIHVSSGTWYGGTGDLVPHHLAFSSNPPQFVYPYATTTHVGWNRGSILLICVKQ